MTNYLTKIYIAAAVISFCVLVNAQTERRLTYVTKGFVPYEQTKDYMLGNNDYGFFIQKLDDDTAICRIRVKVECDYGLGVVKVVKNSNVNITLNKNEMEFRTDNSGLADGWFRCEPSISNKSIQVSVKKYQAKLEIKSFPKIISIEEKLCW